MQPVYQPAMTHSATYKLTEQTFLMDLTEEQHIILLWFAVPLSHVSLLEKFFFFPIPVVEGAATDERFWTFPTALHPQVTLLLTWLDEHCPCCVKWHLGRTATYCPLTSTNTTAAPRSLVTNARAVVHLVRVLQHIQLWIWRHTGIIIYEHLVPQMLPLTKHQGPDAWRLELCVHTAKYCSDQMCKTGRHTGDSVTVGLSARPRVSSLLPQHQLSLHTAGWVFMHLYHNSRHAPPWSPRSLMGKITWM